MKIYIIYYYVIYIFININKSILSIKNDGEK